MSVEIDALLKRLRTALQEVDLELADLPNSEGEFTELLRELGFDSAVDRARVRKMFTSAHSARSSTWSTSGFEHPVSQSLSAYGDAQSPPRPHVVRHAGNGYRAHRDDLDQDTLSPQSKLTMGASPGDPRASSIRSSLQRLGVPVVSKRLPSPSSSAISLDGEGSPTPHSYGEDRFGLEKAVDETMAGALGGGPSRRSQTMAETHLESSGLDMRAERRLLRLCAAFDPPSPTSEGRSTPHSFGGDRFGLEVAVDETMSGALGGAASRRPQTTKDLGADDLDLGAERRTLRLCAAFDPPSPT